MKFEIRNVKNGLVVAVWLTEDENKKEEIVFQEEFAEEDSVEAFATFLRCLNEHYGPSTSRHSPKRIYVLVRPGDKNDAFTDEDGDVIFSS